MKVIERDIYGNTVRELRTVSEEKWQIAASLFKWGICGAIGMTTIVYAGVIGVVMGGMFVMGIIAIKAGM